MGHRLEAAIMSEVALIVGGGPGVSASCARLFVAEGMKVAIAARSPEKESMQKPVSYTHLTLPTSDLV